MSPEVGVGLYLLADEARAAKSADLIAAILTAFARG